MGQSLSRFLSASYVFKSNMIIPRTNRQQNTFFPHDSQHLLHYREKKPDDVHYVRALQFVQAFGWRISAKRKNRCDKRLDNGRLDFVNWPEPLNA